MANIQLKSSSMPRYVGAKASVTRTENGIKISMSDYQGATEETIVEAIDSITTNADGSLTFALPDGREIVTDSLKGAPGAYCGETEPTDPDVLVWVDPSNEDGSVLKLKENGEWTPVTTIIGEAAGFGTVSASVDSNHGTPSVTVTATGDDTAKNFAFEFKNLQPAPYDDSVIQARMDSFTQLPAGSTSGDAELIDGRVGADGVTYNNIGTANRTQFSNLKSDINYNVNDASLITTAYQGAIGTASPPTQFVGMDLVASSTRIRTLNDKSTLWNGIIIPANSKVKISADNGYKFAYQVYSVSSGAALDTYEYKTGDFTIQKTEAVSLVLTLAKTDNSDIVPTEMSHVSLEVINDLKDRIAMLESPNTVSLPFTLQGVSAEIYKTKSGKYEVKTDIPKIKKTNGTVAFISPTGLHTNDGLTVNTPVKTIAEALAVPNVETIIFLEGTYTASTHFYVGEGISIPVNMIGLGNVVIDNVQGGNNNPIEFTASAYVKNIHFKHGNNTVKATLDSNETIAFEDCIFSDSDNAQWSNGLAVLGGSAYIVNCKAYNNAYDGFNYHANDNVISYAIEVNCESYNNGQTALSDSSGQSSNGSTTHDGGYIVRVNGNYYACHGGVVADLNSHSANYGCKAGVSTVIDSANYADRMSNYWASGTDMYLYDCESYGSKYDTAKLNGGTITSNVTYGSNYSA